MRNKVQPTLQKKYMTFPIYTDRNRGYVWEWILRVWDNGERNTKLDESKFTDMSPLSRDSGFNDGARVVRKGSSSLVG